MYDTINPALLWKRDDEWLPPGVKQEPEPIDSKPISSDDPEVFEVEEIIGHKFIHGKLRYEVLWKGYEERTWEPMEHLEQDVVKEYIQKLGFDPATASRRTRISSSPQRRGKLSRVRSPPPTPPSSEPRVPAGSWDGKIKEIRALEKMSNGKLMAYVVFKDPRYEQIKVSLSILRQKGPQKLIEYYERHLSFNDEGMIKPGQDETVMDSVEY